MQSTVTLKKRKEKVRGRKGTAGWVDVHSVLSKQETFRENWRDGSVCMCAVCVCVNSISNCQTVSYRLLSLTFPPPFLFSTFSCDLFTPWKERKRKRKSQEVSSVHSPHSGLQVHTYHTHTELLHLMPSPCFCSKCHSKSVSPSVFELRNREEERGGVHVLIQKAYNIQTERHVSVAKRQRKDRHVYRMHSTHTFFCSSFHYFVDVSFASPLVLHTFTLSHDVTCMYVCVDRMERRVCLCIYTSISFAASHCLLKRMGCSSVKRTQIELLWAMCMCVSWIVNFWAEQKERDIWKSSGRERRSRDLHSDCLILSPLFPRFAK